MFVNKYVNWDEYEEPFYKLWYFNSNGYDNKITEMRILQQNGLSEELIQFYIDHNNWCGCFGGMFMADIGWVRRFCEICDLEKVFEVVRDREMRMSWERVFAVYSEVLYGGYGGGNHNANIFGDIHDYIQWGTSFDEYLQMKERGELEEYPVVKTWVGR